MGYRKLPYGYRMEMGETCINEEEATYVKQIFSDYLDGASFKSIAEELTGHSITFDGEKPWNKNMVARLLSDERYTGKAGFPEIIPIEVLDKAVAKRQAQKKPQLPSSGYRVAQKLSGSRFSEDIEHQLLALLNWLISNPEEIALSKCEIKYGKNPNRAELDATLRQLPIDEDRAKELIIQGTLAAYESIPTSEHETRHLQHLFKHTNRVREIDADFLRATITRINTRSGHLVSVVLKNGQTVEYQPER